MLVAAFFAGNQDYLDLKALADLNLDSLLDVLPAGLIKDAQDLQVSALFLLAFRLLRGLTSGSSLLCSL